MQRISIQPAGDLSDLATRWQALECRADPGFFRSWVFIGCLAAERFAGARLLCVTQDGHDVALALLGSGRGKRWLNQTGDIAQDSVFIEHNGVLAEGRAHSHIVAALQAAARPGPLALSGIDDPTLAAANQAGWVSVAQTRWAPSVALHALDRPYLETLSANARSQIRRSLRLYGPDLKLARAETLPQAQEFFAELIGVHQAAWQARGRPGAFADPHMRKFHAELIARAWPTGGADLLRVTAGARHIGTLYNLLAGGRVYCYQSGFAYSDDAREKPGLCCHALAIAQYASAGARIYDLLGGADRYKLTLAQGGQMLHWATLHRRWSVGGCVSKTKVFFFAKKKQKTLAT